MNIKLAVKITGLLFINLIFFELILRLLVFCVFQLHAFNFAKNMSDRNIKVLVLGESTSDAQFSARAWPTQLKETLNSERKNAQVLNFAVSGINTTLLLNDLESQIRYHKPQILISMMGINDNTGNWYYDNDLLNNDNFLLNLRIVKLFKLAFAYVAPKSSASNISDGLKFSIPASLAELLSRREFLLAKPEFTSAMSNLSDGERAALATAVLKQIADQNLGQPEVLFEAFNSLEVYPKVKDLVPKDNSLALHVLMALKPSEESIRTCELIANGYVENNSLKPSNLVTHFLTKCLSAENEILRMFVNRFVPNIKNSKLEDKTKNNYLQVKRLINENLMCWLIVQYPLLRIEERKSYFSDEDLKSGRINFVSNFENFETALKGTSYESLFIDKFAEHFGHTTEYGSKLIADQVYPALIEFMNNPKCTGRP